MTGSVWIIKQVLALLDLEVFSQNSDQIRAIFEQMARILILAQFLGMYIGPQTQRTVVPSSLPP